MDLLKISKNKKKALVLGETKLCVQCVEYITNHGGWDIISIVSDDAIVIEWGRQNLIKVIPFIRLDEIKENGFYVFSIINPYLIPASFLIERKVVLALNYHDSLLPKYAGPNSTTWAIINNEEFHGSTLHKIVTCPDAGDIAAQTKISIDKFETALSLNLKCSYALLNNFNKILHQIDNQSLEFTPQKLEHRTYFGYRVIPTNYAIINGINDCSELSRLSRALGFGRNYVNPVASIKIFINKQFYIVDDLFENENMISGIFNKDLDNKLFFNIRDVYGRPTYRKINIRDINKKYVLKNSDLNYLSGIKLKERDNYKKILRTIKNDAEVMQILDYNSSSYSLTAIECIEIPPSFATEDILSIICIVLAKIFNQSFLASLYLDNINIPPKLKSLIEYRNFIGINLNNLKSGFQGLVDKLKAITSDSYLITKDFGYRYHIDLLTDVAIALGKISIIDQHRIVVNIVDNQIMIMCCEKDYDIACLIVRSLKILISNYESKNDLSHTNLDEICLLDEQQYKRIVYDLNSTNKPFPHDKSIHQLFEEQVILTPNNIAIRYDDMSLTYSELNSQSNKVARYLTKNFDIRVEDLIVICLDRTQYLFISMLAVLKLGAAYVTIDPNNPEERIHFILTDTNADIIITSDINANKLTSMVFNFTDNYEDLKSSKCKMINYCYMLTIDNQKHQNIIEKQKPYNLKKHVPSDRLAYVMYTSGTTGKPKGVMIEHKNVISLIKNVSYIKIDSTDCVMQLADIAFDAVTFEIWGALLNGAKLYVPSKIVYLLANVYFLEKLMITNNVSILWLTKTLFDQLYLQNNKLFRQLNYLLVGGEALNYDLIKELVNSKYKPKHLINGYGPTENTTFSCVFEVTSKNILNLKSVPIGRPITNRFAYILDGNHTPVPIGAVGELYLSGAGVARGYLNQPELTKLNFVDNIFQRNKNHVKQLHSQLYKTGDLVRMTPNENIEYIGRNDHQIKRNGYRIELSELETQLLGYQNIKQAVFIYKTFTGNSGVKNLVGYYVLNDVNSNQHELDYVTTWQNMYRETYKNLALQPVENNFTGWESSYTGLPIELEHMQEWLDNIIFEIKFLKPTNILEIGSGSGLILFNVINSCNHYYATDFSEQAVEYIKLKSDKYNLSNKIDLQVCNADDIHYSQIKLPVDTVIINSVVQYFPNIYYFENIIGKLLHNFRDNILQIVIGDIRDYRLLDIFYYSILVYRNGYTTEQELEFYKKRDKELLISPLYFFELTATFPQISYVEILAKESDYENEMSKFRYDVLLYIMSSTHNPASLVKHVYYNEFNIVNDIQQFIEINSEQTHVFIKYPNKKIYKDSKDYKRFVDANQSAMSIGTHENYILQISQIKTIGKKYNFNAKFYIDIYDYEYLNIVFYKGNQTSFRIIYNNNGLKFNKLFNDPGKIAKILDTKLSDEIKRYLLKKIPPYMMPDMLIGIDKLPLTQTGKLDRESLPEPEYIILDDYIAPTTELEVKICSIFSEVLGLFKNQIGKYHDFFKLGGNSILAIKLATKLQNDFEISVTDIFRLRTPAKIAESVKFVKDNLRNKLEEIKLIYTNKKKIQQNDRLYIKSKIGIYHEAVKHVCVSQQCKPIDRVLLTGATGYLGCNILFQLLMETNYKIYLPVRSDSDINAYKRVVNKFKYYFDLDIEMYKDRLIIFAADLSKTDFMLDNELYQELVLNVDSIIHAAALVKHYGDYDEFYQANVKSTKNLLELAKLTRNKDFHYVSTIGIFMEGYIPKHNFYIFSEYDNPDMLVGLNNLYLQTKYEGEQLANEYKKNGIAVNIYRIGNLSANSKNFRNQENLEENNFFHRVRTMLMLGMIPDEFSHVEISPVDCTALGIVKIFDKVSLKNGMYHLFNPNLCNLIDVFNKFNDLNIRKVTIEKFIESIILKLDTEERNISLFMLHQRWLEEVNRDQFTQIEILNDRTNEVLAKLGLKWPKITKQMLSEIVYKTFKKSVENEKKRKNF